MKVRIVQATRQTAWYFGKIGEVFPVIEDPMDPRYYIVTAGGPSRFIRKVDCVILLDNLKFELDAKLFEI